MAHIFIRVRQSRLLMESLMPKMFLMESTMSPRGRRTSPRGWRTLEPFRSNRSRDLLMEQSLHRNRTSRRLRLTKLPSRRRKMIPRKPSPRKRDKWIRRQGTKVRKNQGLPQIKLEALVQYRINRDRRRISRNRHNRTLEIQ